MPGAILTPYIWNALDPHNTSPRQALLLSSLANGNLSNMGANNLVQGPRTSKRSSSNLGSPAQGIVPKGSQTELCLRCYLEQEFFFQY